MYSSFEIGGKSKFGLLGLIAFLFFGFQVYAFLQSQSAAKWPTANGQISLSDMENTRSVGRRSRGRYNQRAVVEYRYKVRGKWYTNDRVRFTDGSSVMRITQWNPQGILDDFPAGKKVTVSYDPKDPSNAVLETALPISSFVWMSISTVVLAISGMCFFADCAEPAGL